jgi:hypothetical protein
MSPRSDLLHSNARILEGLRGGIYDFIDLGTNQGGGFKIAEKLGGRRGAGFDLNPALVKWNLERQRDVMYQDVRTLPADISGVRFAICSHILEHLPNIYDVGTVISALVRNSSEFILLYGPNFDSEEYLYKRNLKLVHSAMEDHLCKFRTIDLVKVLFDLGLRDFVLGLSGPIKDSTNGWIHRADAPSKGIWTWDAEKSLPKPTIQFDQPIFRDFICVVRLDVSVDYSAVIKNFLWGCSRIVLRSNYRFPE